MLKIFLATLCLLAATAQNARAANGCEGSNNPSRCMEIIIDGWQSVYACGCTTAEGAKPRREISNTTCQGALSAVGRKYDGSERTCLRGTRYCVQISDKNRNRPAQPQRCTR
jgi:hypothetical protein